MLDRAINICHKGAMILTPQQAADYLAGFFDGEGCLHLHSCGKTASITASNKEETLIDFVVHCAKQLHIAARKYTTPRIYVIRILGGVEGNRNFLRNVPLQNDRKRHQAQRIWSNWSDSSYQNLDVSDPRWYIAGLFDGEGSVSKYSREAEISNCDETLIDRARGCFHIMNVFPKKQIWETSYNHKAYRLRFPEEALQSIPFQSLKHARRLAEQKQKVVYKKSPNYLSAKELRLRRSEFI